MNVFAQEAKNKTQTQNYNIFAELAKSSDDTKKYREEIFMLNKKHRENAKNSVLTHTISTEDGQNLGNISKKGYEAIENNKLDGYTPINDTEKKTIEAYKAYAENPKNKIAELDKQLKTLYADKAKVNTYAQSQEYDKAVRRYESAGRNGWKGTTKEKEQKLFDEAQKKFNYYKTIDSQIAVLENDKKIIEVFDRHGLDMDNFNYMDLREWAKNNNFNVLEKISFDGDDIKPKKEGLFGKKITTEQEETDLEALKYFVQNKGLKEFAEEHPWLATSVTVVAAPVRAAANIVATGEDIINTVTGKGINLMSPLKSMQTGTNIIRGVGSGKASEWFGGAEAPVIGNVGAFIYGVGTSLGDSAMNMLAAGAIGGALGGSTKIVSNIMSGLTGSNVVQSEIVSAKERGLSDVNALVTGLASGAVETLTEKFSVDAILKNPATLGKRVLKGFVAEGSEEMAAEVAGTFVDVLINQSDSEFRKKINSYMTEDGLNEKDAIKKAYNDLFNQTLSAGLAGGLSGMGMGGAYTSINSTYGASKLGAQLKNDVGADVVVEMASEFAESTKTAKKAAQLQKDIDSGKTISDHAIGSLYQTMAEETESIPLSERYSNVSDGVMAVAKRVENADVNTKLWVIGTAMKAEKVLAGQGRTLTEVSNAAANLSNASIKAISSAFGKVDAGTSLYGVNLEALSNSAGYRINAQLYVNVVAEAIKKNDSVLYKELSGISKDVGGLIFDAYTGKTEASGALRETVEKFAGVMNSAVSNGMRIHAMVYSGEAGVKQSAVVTGNSVAGTNEQNVPVSTENTPANEDVTNIDGDKSMYDIMDELGLTKDEQYAIMEYKSSGSYKINDTLRKKVALSADQRKFKDDINSALDKFPTYEGVVFRNIGFETKEEFEDFIAEHSGKTSITYPAFTSAGKTIDSYPVETSYRVHYKILSHNSKDASSVGLTGENEVLFKTDTEFTIKSFEVSGNEITILCEELTNNGTELHPSISETGNKKEDNGVAEQSAYIPRRDKHARTLDSVREGSGEVHGIPQEESTSGRGNAGNSDFSDSVELRKDNRNVSVAQGELEHNNVKNNASGILVKVSDAIERSLRPEIKSNPELMNMLRKRFGGDGITALAEELITRYKRDKSIEDFENLFTDGGKELYAALRNERFEKLKYSISSEHNDENNIFTVPQTILKTFSNQVDDWINGKLTPEKQLELGDTPEVIKALGAKSLPIMMSQDVLVKITGEKHSISLDEVKRLPIGIADPIMVFKSNTVPDSFVILTEIIDKSGNDVVAALHLNKYQDRIRINRIASVYGKNGVVNFVSNQMKNGNLKYMDKNKSQNWSTSRGLQLPKLVQSNPDNNIILQKDDIVNNYFMQQDAKYSVEGEIDNGRHSLLSDGSDKRAYSTSARKQAKRVDGRSSRYREGRTTAYERRKYCRTIKASGLTKQKVIYGHKCEVIPAEHYTPRMNKVAEQNKKNGFAETIFITGKAEIPFVKDKNGNFKKSKGIYIEANGKKIVVVQYDNEFYTPEQINDHEIIHDRYHTPLVQKAKNIIINSLSVAEKRRVLENLSRDYNGIIDNEVKEELIEEFVANVLSDMDYAYIGDFSEIQRAYWKGDEQFIDNYKVSEYTESIDTGEPDESVLEIIGLGNDYRLSESDDANRAFAEGSLVNEHQDALTNYEWKQYFDKVNQLDWDADTRNRKFDFVIIIVNKIIKSHYNKTRPQVYSVEYLNLDQTVKSLIEGGFIYDQDTKRILETLAAGTEQNNQRAVDTNIYGNQGQGSIGESVSASIEKYGQPSRNNDSVDPVHSPINQGLESVNVKYVLSTDDVNTDFWDEFLSKAKQYGTIPAGEKPAREIQVPKKIADDKPVSRFARTMMEAGVTPEFVISEFEKGVLDGTLTHEVITNKKASDYAEKRIRELGFEGALNRWTELAAESKVGKKQFALGIELYNQCVNNRDVKNAMKIAAELASEATRAGEVLQACRMLKQMNPDGQLYYLEKSIEKINDEFRERLGKKYKDIEIDEKLFEEYLIADSDETRNSVYDRICQYIADRIPATNMDKWNSWRYLAMLGNPRTHIRNIAGNAVFVPAIRMKNYVGAVLERVGGIKTEERTKSVRKEKKAIQFAEKDFVKMEKILKGENAKYAVTSDIEGKRRIFKTKWLEKWRLKNFDFLENEDMWFLKMHYIDSLARIITARKLDVESMDEKVLYTVRGYAIKAAQEATYRDANSLADGLNKFQRKAERGDDRVRRIEGVLLEGVMPFKKAPMNIAKQGVMYSPIGIMSTLYKKARLLKNGEMLDPVEFLDSLAKGLTGTGIILLGYFLAKIGMLSGGDDENEKKKAFDKMTGEQSYAVKAFGKSYTIDWVTPTSLPLFVGSTLYEISQGDTIGFREVAEALTKLPEPLLELSVFSGISDLFETAKYSNSGAVGAIMIDMGISYLLQALPTIGGQISRVIDETRRNYYYADKTKDVPDGIQRLIGRAASKIPFASYLFEPYVDEWGRIDTYGGLAERSLENFVSPGYYSQEEYTAVDKEIKRLYEKTGESKVLPIEQSRHFVEDGIKYDMSAADYAETKIIRGQESFRLVKALMNDERIFKKQKKVYSNMTDEEKVNAISKCYQQAGDYAKEKMLEKVKKASGE